MIFTINSDDEIEKEVDEEVEEPGPTYKQSKRSKKEPMRFEFDEGRMEQTFRSKKKSKVMPRIEERSQRAMIKKNLREPSKERSKADIIQDDESDENGGDDDSADEHEYFDEVVDSTSTTSGYVPQFTLSRSILRAIESGLRYTYGSTG